MTVSCVQILEVRVQCVVVDVHIDQALQKKKNSKSNINMFLSQGIDTNKRVSVGVTTSSLPSLFLENLSCPSMLITVIERLHKNK